MQVHHIDANMAPEQWPTVRDMMKHEKRIAFETNLLRKDGSLVPVEVIGNYLFYNELAYFCTFARDLTERKQVEAERAAAQQQVIDAQREALRELSTPLIPIAEGVVIMPLIGSIDSLRAQMVMEALLEGVARHRAHSVILDITGVQVVDTQVANTFISAAQAVRLLGAQVIMSGIQPAIAQTLVQLGVDLSGIITVSSLQAGIAHTLLAQQG
jgi:rsbT co-antagonist protein RsbR